ncbi:MAG: 16S rRNA (guanine(966)-N(2))-methyltransferase RsmD [Betaproteobacteria bacterium]
MPENRVRIVGGRWRSRWIEFPDADGLRPTPDRVRETLFNWLGQDLTGCTCLDLFAGSGALGLEAASRGAREVIMVERDRRVAESLEASAASLQKDPAPGTIEVVRSDALEFLSRDRRVYDVMFVDPPFGQWQARGSTITDVLSRLTTRLAAGARVYVEAPAMVALPPEWQVLKQSRAGAVYFQLLEVNAT